MTYETSQSTYVYIIYLLEGDKEVRKKKEEREDELLHLLLSLLIPYLRTNVVYRVQNI